MTNQIVNALPTGYEIDGYRIESELGAGGFGITYRAEQLALGRTVAIKEYLPSGLAVRANDGKLVEPRSRQDVEDFEYGLASFQEEGKTLVNFDHPNIVTAYDFRQSNGTAYLVMQYVEGKSLEELILEQGSLDEQQIKKILFPVLDGIEQVHEAGFLHRDINPSNIIIRPNCVPVIVDFGSARCALRRKRKKFTTIVTDGYAPIEQYTNRMEQGPWTEIYGLGATLYHAITGAPPPEAVGRTHNDNIVPAIEAGAGRYSDMLLTTVDRALVVRAEDRLQSIAEFRSLLESPASSQRQRQTRRKARRGVPEKPGAGRRRKKGKRTPKPAGRRAAQARRKAQPAPASPKPKIEDAAWRRVPEVAPHAMGTEEPQPKSVFDDTLILGGNGALPVTRPALRHRKWAVAAMLALVIAGASAYAVNARFEADRIAEARYEAERLHLKAVAEARRKAEQLRIKAAWDARANAEKERLAEEAEARRQAVERARIEAAAEAKRKADEARRQAEARPPQREPRRSYDLDTQYDIVRRPSGFTVTLYYAPFQLFGDRASVIRECRSRVRIIANRTAARHRHKIDRIGPAQISVRLQDRGFLLSKRTTCQATGTFRYL